MRLLVNEATGTIHDASNVGAWRAPDGYAVVEHPGDADAYVWPNGHPARCRWVNDAIVANAAVPRLPPSARQVSTRGLVDTFTPTEWSDLKVIIAASDTFVQKEFDAWLANHSTDLNSLRFTTLAAQLALDLWPDPAVRARRMADVHAVKAPAQ